MQARKFLWKFTPKAHSILHCVRDFAPQQNPRTTTSYMGEDFCGRLKRIAGACHPSPTALTKRATAFVFLLGVVGGCAHMTRGS